MFFKSRQMTIEVQVSTHAPLYGELNRHQNARKINQYRIIRMTIIISRRAGTQMRGRHTQNYGFIGRRTPAEQSL